MMVQRVKRAERVRRQKRRELAVWKAFWAEVEKLRNEPPLRADDYIFRAAQSESADGSKP